MTLLSRRATVGEGAFLPSPGGGVGGAGRGAGGEGRAAGRLLLALAFALLTLTACGGRPGEQVETTAPVPVVTQPVRRGAIRRLIPATGIVKPAAGADLLVTVPQAARIAELPKGVGDRVRTGDLLARFEVPAL